MEKQSFSLLLLLILVALGFLAVCLSVLREQKSHQRRKIAQAQQEIDDFLAIQQIVPTTREQQCWLAFGAPIFLQLHEPIKQIAPEVSLYSLSQYKSQLQQRWTIKDSETATIIIEHLLSLQESHHLDLQLKQRGLEVESCLVEFTADDEPTSLAKAQQTRSTYAWDTARAIALSRWCFWCGYIDQDRMWRYIKQAAQTAQTNGLGSWVDYSVSMLLGQTLAEKKRLDRSLDTELLRLLGAHVYNTDEPSHLPAKSDYEIAIWREFNFSCAR